MSELCHKLHRLFSEVPKLGFPFDTKALPPNGVYILFEQGEFGHEADRIVRIGTHTGDRQLRSRLKEHFIKENKDRSIFRKNIGRALLNRDADSFLGQWELDLTTSAAKTQYAHMVNFQKLRDTEKRVTEYIQRNFRFIVFRVDEKRERLQWESKIISTVSSCDECRASETWLGLHSPKAKIRESGLWIVNELYKQPLSESDFEAVKIAVFWKS